MITSSSIMWFLSSTLPKGGVLLTLPAARKYITWWRVVPSANTAKGMYSQHFLTNWIASSCVLSLLWRERTLFSKWDLMSTHITDDHRHIMSDAVLWLSYSEDCSHSSHELRTETKTALSYFMIIMTMSFKLYNSIYCVWVFCCL